MRYQTGQRSRFYYGGVAAGLGAILAISRLVAPSDLPVVLCLPDVLIGIPCLTTGLTRSFHATANLRLADAAGFHPFGPFFFLVTLWHFVIFSARIAGWRRSLLTIDRPVRAMLLFTLLLTGIVWTVRVALIVVGA